MSEKILSYEDYIIRKRDLALLTGKEWLNDTLIGFFFQYLGDQVEEQGCLFVGPEVTQLIKLTPEDQIPLILSEVIQDILSNHYAFFPVNNSEDLESYSGGSHWSLLVYSKVDAKFIHFDSCPNSNSKDAQKIAQKLSPLLGNFPLISAPSCLSQVNSFDCGCHVLQNAQLISTHVRKGNPTKTSLLSSTCPSASPQQAAEIRPQLLKLIMELSSKQ